MIQDESWMEPVPKSVADFIKEIDGVNRLRDLLKQTGFARLPFFLLKPDCKSAKPKICND